MEHTTLNGALHTQAGAVSTRKRSADSAQSVQSPYTSNFGTVKTTIRRVSRACDFCKSRKARCSGDQPCSKCIQRRQICHYNAKYTRGRPPTPLALINSCSGLTVEDSNALIGNVATTPVKPVSVEEGVRSPQRQSLPPSRASPDVDVTEIQGQVFGPTSGLALLNRAWKRLLTQDVHSISDCVKPLAEQQLMIMAGDRPLPHASHSPPYLPNPTESRMLLSMYFDVCIATYRFLHRPSVEKWLEVVERNIVENRPVWVEIGHARAAIVFAALAIATIHQEKSQDSHTDEDGAELLKSHDELYCTSAHLTEIETGHPKLESVQARLAQVLYLLTTSRFSKGWYVFGNALQTASVIGLHHRANSKRRGLAKPDYVHQQCRIRTFWTAYILDNYLGMVFGRPRHFHDEDLEQDFPDRINDEEMTPRGPKEGTPKVPQDSHTDALISHAK